MPYIQVLITCKSTGEDVPYTSWEGKYFVRYFCKVRIIFKDDNSLSGGCFLLSSPQTAKNYWLCMCSLIRCT